MDFLNVQIFASLRDKLLNVNNGLSRVEKEVTERMLLYFDSRETILNIALEYYIEKHRLCRGDAGVCSHQEKYYEPCSSYISANSESDIDQGSIQIPNWCQPQVTVWGMNQPIHFPEIRTSNILSRDVANKMLSVGTKSMTVSKIECYGQKIGTFCLDSTHDEFVWNDSMIGNIHYFNDTVISEILWYNIHYMKAVEGESEKQFMECLTDKDIELLDLLVREMSIDEAAHTLNISTSGARARISKLKKRLGGMRLMDIKNYYQRLRFKKKKFDFRDFYSKT